MATGTRTYRFAITFAVEPGYPAYDDPEWAADAAWGTLNNEYGLLSHFSDLDEVRTGTRE